MCGGSKLPEIVTPDQFSSKEVSMAIDPIYVQLPPLLTVRDIRRICRIGERQAYELAHAVGPIKLGRSLRVRTEDLNTYLRELTGRSAA
jgi:hypothetical protein